MRSKSTGLLLVAVGTLAFVVTTAAHGPGDAITWNREIARVVYDKCAGCHRPEGTAFSLLTFKDVQPRGNAIKEAVLSRRMPPWGAVKGFGRFRNDRSLSQEQIELVTKWVDGGIRRGNNPNMLPKLPAFAPELPIPAAGVRIQVTGTYTLKQPLSLDGLVPERVLPNQDLRIVAVTPAGRVQPLVWLNGYDTRFPHPFLFARPVSLPTGTIIQGVAGAVIALIQGQ